MSGGFGKRLGKLTKKSPKGMLLYKNKPLLEHIITLAKENGIVKYIGRVPEDITEVEASRQMSLCAKHAYAWLEIAAKNNNSEIETNRIS